MRKVTKKKKALPARRARMFGYQDASGNPESGRLPEPEETMGTSADMPILAGDTSVVPYSPPPPEPEPEPKVKTVREELDEDIKKEPGLSELLKRLKEDNEKRKSSAKTTGLGETALSTGDEVSGFEYGENPSPEPNIIDLDFVLLEDNSSGSLTGPAGGSGSSGPSAGPSSSGPSASPSSPSSSGPSAAPSAATGQSGFSKAKEGAVKFGKWFVGDTMTDDETLKDRIASVYGGYKGESGADIDSRLSREQSKLKDYENRKSSRQADVSRLTGEHAAIQQEIYNLKRQMAGKRTNTEEYRQLKVSLEVLENQEREAREKLAQAKRDYAEADSAVSKKNREIEAIKEKKQDWQYAYFKGYEKYKKERAPLKRGQKWLGEMGDQWTSFSKKNLGFGGKAGAGVEFDSKMLAPPVGSPDKMGKVLRKPGSGASVTDVVYAGGGGASSLVGAITTVRPSGAVSLFGARRTTAGHLVTPLAPIERMAIPKVTANVGVRVRPDNPEHGLGGGGYRIKFPDLGRQKVRGIDENFVSIPRVNAPKTPRVRKKVVVGGIQQDCLCSVINGVEQCSCTTSPAPASAMKSKSKKKSKKKLSIRGMATVKPLNLKKLKIKI